MLSKDEIIAMISRPESYVEILLIVVAFAVAFLLAALAKSRASAYLNDRSFKRIDPEFVKKILALLAPLLALIGLGVVKPLVEQYGAGGGWLIASSQLCLAYLVARLVLIVVPSRLVAWFIAVVVMIIGALDAAGLIDSTKTYLNSMAFSVGEFHISLLGIVQGIIILVVVLWGAGLLSRTLESYLRRSSSLSYNARELSVKFFRIFIYFIAITITLSAVGVDLTAFAVFGGALGVGIA